MPRGDGPFQVIERIGDNAYKLDLPGEYSVSSTFNVADLSLFDVGHEQDLRTNPFQEGEDDANTIAQAPRKAWDPLELPEGPITRGRMRRFKEALQGIMKINYEVPNSSLGESLEVNMIQVCKGNSKCASKMKKCEFLHGSTDPRPDPSTNPVYPKAATNFVSRVSTEASTDPSTGSVPM